MPGREKQLAEYEERATRLSELHQLVGRIRVEVAPRGVGKTSLLRQVQRKMTDRNLAVVWVTAGENATLVSAIYAELVQLTTTWKTSAKNIFVDSLESVSVTIGVQTLARVEAKWSKQAETAPNGARQFEVVIRAAVAAARAQGKDGLVIFIDEVQLSDAESLRSISYAWQHLQGEGENIPAAIFGAGLPNSADEITSKVTFSERFEFRQLQLITSDATKLALVAPAAKLGVRWSDEALQFASERAQGYPHKIQLIGEGSWLAATTTDPGGIIELEHAQAGLLDADEQMGNLFRTRWRNSSDQERELMAAMAEFGDAIVARGKVAELMGVKTRELSMLRARLIDKGFIEAVGHGLLGFTVPGFGQWVRDGADE